MKKNTLLILIILLPITIFAQEPDSTTNERLKKLEKIQSMLPKISGLINFRYQYGDDINSFDVRRARIDFRGDLSPVFDYRLQFEFASDAFLLDAYVRAKIKPWLHIQVGEFKIPFTMENPYSPQNLEFIDNSMSTIKLCSYQDISGMKSNGRDVGIMVSGSLFKADGFYMLQYDLGVFNGSGINIRDKDKAKDVVGRISFNPIKHLTISASGYLGKFEVDTDDAENVLSRRDRWSLGIRYDDKKVVARAEYVGGNTGGVKSDGFYVLAGYTFFGRLMPAIRYDFFRNDINSPETYQTDYTVGLNYWATKFLRCQVNYIYKTHSHNADSNSNLVSAMITLSF
ncbi:MAG: OprO/OprP family phosphate-selective porin [Bacteroidales bacterium]|jgi:phosphate-selective porin|nr:OprO/OprP family phosphate-selective porin [Bacteroidales bacterium]